MPTTLHVLYTKDDETTFDSAYFLESHAPMTRDILTDYIDSMMVAKSTETYPGGPTEVYYLVTFVFKSRDSFDQSTDVAGPIHEDIANFYNKRPKLLVGEVIAV